MSQQQTHKTQSTEVQKREAQETSTEHVEQKARTPEQQALLDASDDLLDEIDAAIEGLTEETATAFIQRGGQ